MIKTVILDEPKYNINEILRYCGVGATDKNFLPLIDECIKELKGKLDYRVCFDIFSIGGEDTIEFANIKSNSSTLKAALSQCNKVLIFAATIGLEIDRIIAKYTSSSPSKAVIFQGIGAERIESLCDAFCEGIRAEMKGFTLKRRVSCGYGDIPLEMQSDIFELLDCPRKIGLTLNKSYLMSPTKSVSAFVGISDVKN